MNLSKVSRVMRCQLPAESVKNEISRIIRYMAAYPEEHLYVIESRYGSITYWSLTGVQSIREYYESVMCRDGGEMCCTTVRDSGMPVWMCDDDVISYMEEAGLVEVRGEEAYATPWLMEYNAKMFG